MRSFFHFSLFAILATISVFPSFAMLSSGAAVVSPDKSRYIAFLGHFHKETGRKHEARQLDALVAICKEGVQEGKKFHILYEATCDIIKHFTTKRRILTHLEETFAQAEVPDCIIENVEIRDCGMAASHIFRAEGVVIDPLLTWNTNSKPFEELTFQDVFDEFEKYACELKPFVEQISQVDPACPYRAFVEGRYLQAVDYLDDVKKYLQNNQLPNETKILKLARERVADCKKLGQSISSAFSGLFDSHIFRKVLTFDPSVQLIVIAGGVHAQEAEGLLQAIGWEPRIYKSCDFFAEDDEPLDSQTIRSFVLNETEWDKRVKDTYKYLASMSISLGAQFQTLRDSIISRYCK